MIDKLVKIYNNWGDRPENNNLQPLGSADEMLMHETATMDQCHWLERFLDVWNRVQERDIKKLSDRKRRGSKITNLLDLEVENINDLSDVKKLADWFLDKNINYHPEDDLNHYETNDGQKLFTKIIGDRLKHLWLQAFHNCNHNDVWSIVLRKHNVLVSKVGFNYDVELNEKEKRLIKELNNG